jgi:transcriptional regulator with XRE-family HTH domain
MLQNLDKDLGGKSSKQKPSETKQSTPFSPTLSLFDNKRGRLMTPSQCRAARGLLNWTQDQMASAAHLSVVTVRNFENEKSTPQRATLDVMQRALEAEGVEFTNGDKPGVRLNNKVFAPHRVQPASAAKKTVKAGRKKW